MAINYIKWHEEQHKLRLSHNKEVQELKDGQREEIELLLNEAGCGGVLPSSLVVDETGRVLLIQKGIPSVSQLRQLLQKAGLKPKSVQLHPNAKSPDGTP